MTQGGEQSQQKPRARARLTGPEALPLYAKGTGKSSPMPHTDEYAIDRGMVDPPRPGTSVVRYDMPVTTQAQRTTGSHTGSQSSPTSVPQRRQTGTRNLPNAPRTTQTVKNAKHTHKNIHWLLPVGVGMLAMLALWVVGSWALTWGVQRYNDLRYGNPRTYQTDQVVGHGDSPTHPSHFMAMNLNRQAVVIEFKGGDPTKSVSYIAPVYIAGEGGDLAPVTVEFRDVSGHHRLDMIIHIHLPNQDQLSVFVNDGNGFRPANGNDKIRI